MTRNTHNRLLDHEATDLDTNVVLDGALSAPASTASGATVHQALTDLNAAIGGAGGAIIVSDGVTTVNPTSEIDFVGATVANLGGGVAQVTTTGGGGGSGNSFIVRVVATTNGTLSTAYANGQTVDGATLATGDRILLAAQSTASQNGIYTVNASGAPTRATDYNSQAAIRGSIVEVWDGVHAFSLWANTNNGSITVGTTGLSFQRLADIDVLTILTSRTTLASPGGTSDVTIVDAVVQVDAVHTPGDLVDEGLYLVIGNDGLSLVVSEKSSSVLQFHPASGSSFATEFVDLSGAVFRSVDASGVVRPFSTLESRTGSGTATISSGTTSVTVTHGAGYTPAASDIVVTPTNNPTNDPGNFWVDTIGSTTFAINVRSNPGVSGATFAWRVDR